MYERDVCNDTDCQRFNVPSVGVALLAVGAKANVLRPPWPAKKRVCIGIIYEVFERELPQM